MKRADADDVIFLAGGVAFNVLLAGIPFFLLMAAGLGYILDQSPETAAQVVQTALQNLLPGRISAGGSILDPVLADVIRTRTVVGVWGGLAFIWFAARLFSTLRAVLAFVFMHGRDRGYFHGKLVDLNLIVVSVMLMTAWVSISTVLVLTTGRLGTALESVGVLPDVTGRLAESVLRALAIGVIFLMFLSLYRWLPRRRTHWRSAAVGAAAAVGLFELARFLFAQFMLNYPPSSVYTGTLGAIFIVIFWTYYAALIFVLGAEVAHVHEMRAVAKGEREPRSPLTSEFATTGAARAATLGIPSRPPDAP
ncbi:MAG: YihY/virulence factor BrkB family protein [Gemmatimonadetes bacterium]|nr:YihY/virulence factor BrkB family protein [Gemmatimonadota bacterium]